MRTIAHNTVMIDGADQPETDGKLDQWATSTGYDYVRASFGPYRGCTHTRSILFVKPEYWIVSDDVAGLGEHEFRWLAHFTPNELVVDEANGFVRTQHDHGVNMLAAWADAGDVKLGHAMGYFRKAEPVAPYIWLERKAAPPVRYDVLLAPWRKGMPAPRHWRAVRSADGLIAEIPRGEGRRDVFMRAHDTTTKLEREGYALDGRAALLRYEGQACRSVFAIACKRVTVGGRDVLRADPGAQFAAVDRRGADLHIDCAGAKALWLAMPAPARCWVNGKPAKWARAGDGIEMTVGE